jgi:hypothetical protein
MPIIHQHDIVRADLHKNRGVLYVYGDNLMGKGLGGQAKEMRGEPNAVGIPTKKKPSMLEGSFFCDDDLDEVAPLMSLRIERLTRHLEKGGIVVFPANGIGTQRAELAERAPMIHSYLSSLLIELYDRFPAKIS